MPLPAPGWDTASMESIDEAKLDPAEDEKGYQYRSGVCDGSDCAVAALLHVLAEIYEVRLTSIQRRRLRKTVFNIVHDAVGQGKAETDGYKNQREWLRRIKQVTPKCSSCGHTMVSSASGLTMTCEMPHNKPKARAAKAGH